MQITHYSNIDFDIDRTGKITRKSTWHVMPDEVDLAGWPDVADAVKAWAGTTGDNWRKPNANSISYTTDENYVITQISCKSTARYMYEVSYTGEAKCLEAEMQGQPELSINEFGEREKSAVWLVHKDSLESFLPQAGEVIIWAGALYMFAGATASDAGGNRYEVTVKAKHMDVLMIGLPTYRRNINLESIKTAKWRVDINSYDDFLSSHDINSDASAWAGSGYYITNLSADPAGNGGYYVTIEAKHIGVRKIDVRKSSRYLKTNILGGVDAERTWTGRWQVHKDNLPEFEAMLGGIADDWTGEPGFIVTAVEPTRISEVGYEVSIEAKDADNAADQYAEMRDEKKDLGKKYKVSDHVSDIVLKPDMCGYKSDSTTKTGWAPISGWDKNTFCPLVTSAVLNQALINKPQILLGVTEEYYLKGTPAKYISEMQELVSKKVFTAKIGTHNGSWRLAATPSFVSVIDSKGDEYTKVTRSIVLAPKGYSWNPNYAGEL